MISQLLYGLYTVGSGVKVSQMEAIPPEGPFKVEVMLFDSPVATIKPVTLNQATYYPGP